MTPVSVISQKKAALYGAASLQGGNAQEGHQRQEGAEQVQFSLRCENLQV
jgi:hypothetical protein